MFFVGELVIPANTPATAPATQTLALAVGQITSVAIFFPYKRGAFVGVRVIENEHQLWPTNLDEWIVGDGETVQWAEDHDLADEPFQLRLEGYNDDDTFDHSVYFRLAVNEIAQVEAAASGGLLGQIAGYLGIGKAAGA